MTDGQETVLCVESVSQSHRPASSGWFKSRPELLPLSDVSLTVQSGASLGVVGQHGSGKETLLRMVLGLDTPDQGSVSFLGQDLSGLTRTQRRGLRPHLRHFCRRTVAKLNDRLTANDALKAVLEGVGVTDPEDQKARINEAFRLVSIGYAESQMPTSALSRCQRQRVATAYIIVTRPRLVVVDDPAQGMDVSVQAQLLKLLLDLQDVMDLTLVVSCTNLMVAGSLCDELVVLQSGAVVEAGSSRKILSAPAHPHTQALLSQAQAAEKAA